MHGTVHRHPLPYPHSVPGKPPPALSFCETSGKKSYTDPEEVLKQERKVPEIGKYGKLNAMAGMAPARKKQAMIEYEQEAYLAERIFGKTGSRR